MSMNARNASRASIVNFADSKFCKIRCSSPATDSYEVTNLIDEDSTQRRKGFLSYSAIKPPVNIDFDIICPVHLHYISINACVGSQKCTAVEILGKTSTLDEFQPMSLAYFSEPGLLLCNGRIYSKDNLPADKSHYCLRYFKSKMFRIFMNTSHIRIRILRTENSVPCLGGVEIVGRVSKSASHAIKTKIDNLMEETAALQHLKRFGCESDPMEATSSSKKLKLITGEADSTLRIPDDFIDPLTCEVMSVPITLPSGNTVDQSTLDKYVNVEASYGRHPSDPFTGLKFTADRKPSLNIGLKNRIDFFLICNAHKTETFAIQRTLGGKSRSDSNITALLKKETATTAIAPDSQTKKDDSDGSKSCPPVPDPSSGTLDAAVKKAMSSPSFVSFSEEEEGKRTEGAERKTCEVCKICDTLYVLDPCKHLYCKKCLFAKCIDVLKCFACGETFLRESVKRFH